MKFLVVKVVLFCLDIVIRILVNLIIIVKLKTFKETNKIFVNFNSFGHSIIDTTAFFSVFGYKSVCISVGSFNDRNKYFKKLYKPYRLINFWLPNFELHRIHLRVKIGLAIQKSIEGSILLRILNPNLGPCAQAYEVIDRAAVEVLEDKYLVPFPTALKTIEELKNEFKDADNVNGSSLQILVGNRCRQQKLSVAFLEEHINKFQIKINSIANKINIKEPKVCTLIVRQSKKAWSGVGIEGYLCTLDFLKKQNYIVHVIGDDINVKKFRKIDPTINIFTFSDYKFKKKIFDIVSVYLSDFTFGDPSGAQCIPHFFNKRCLILNNIAVGQIQYNSTILPQIWKDQLNNRASLKLHLDILLYRQTPLHLPDGKILSPHFNDTTTIINCLKDFLNLDSKETKSFSEIFDLSGISYLPSLLKYSEKSEFSKVFTSLLD